MSLHFASHQPTLQRGGFHKKSYFEYKDGMPIVHQDEDALAARGADFPGEAENAAAAVEDPTVWQSLSPGRNARSAEKEEKLPDFVTLDRKVLRFDGWFKESLPDTALEDYRIRRCILYYYIVDNTVRIAEPKIENSGIPQGSFLRRHQVKKPDGSLLTWRDLRVGEAVNIYGRELHLTDTDQFSREFYSDKGISHPGPQDVPEDPYTTKRAATIHASAIRSHRTKAEDDRARFLQYNRKVLRFYAAWDDQDSLYGERRTFVLHYFLEDQTMEVLESKAPNSGRDSFPRMLSRQRLPKKYGGLGDMSSQDIVTDKDLVLGETIHVFGRDFFLYDCDESTKEHMRERFGISEFPDFSEQIRDKKTPLARMKPPPYTGFGTFEDSLGSFYNLVPKVPRKTGSKQHLDGIQLRWQGRIKPGTSSDDDAERRFVITFYPSDDTIGIYEPKVHNSGVLGGKFLERGAIYKSGTNSNGNPDRYSYTDFVDPANDDFGNGRELKVHSHIFELLDCDAFTRRFIAGEQDGGPNSLDDVHKQLKRIAAKSKARMFSRFREKDSLGDGKVFMDDLLAVLREFGVEIPESMHPKLKQFWKATADGHFDYINMMDHLSVA